MQPAGVIPLPVGGVLAEASRLPHALGEIFAEVADVATGFFGAAEDALGVHLRPESDDVRRFGQVRAGVIPGREWRAGVGSVNALAWVSQTGSRSPP